MLVKSCPTVWNTGKHYIQENIQSSGKLQDITWPTIKQHWLNFYTGGTVPSYVYVYEMQAHSTNVIQMNVQGNIIRDNIRYIVGFRFVAMDISLDKSESYDIYQMQALGI